MLRFLFLLAFPLATSAQTSGQAIGDLDPSFGDGGLQTTNVGTSPYQMARALLVLPNGGLVVAGASSSNFGGFSSRFGLAQYRPDGTLDPAFSGDGLLIISFGGSSGSARAVARQPDGALILAGSANTPQASHRALALARVLPDGTLDDTFGQNGRVVTDLSDPESPHPFSLAAAVAVQRDGRILVAGEATSSSGMTDAVLVRYLPTGELDASFGDRGVVYERPDEGAFRIGALAVLSDGKIVLGGLHPGEDDLDFAVVRFLANGERDTTFGDGGLTVVDVAADDTPSLALAPGGGIVLAGTVRVDGLTSPLTTMRFSTDGTLDPDYGVNGIAMLSLDGLAAFPGALHVDTDGRAVVAGVVVNDRGGATTLVAQLRPDGSPDPAFGTDGVSFVPVPESLEYSGSAGVGRQPDGRLVVAGTAVRNVRREFMLAGLEPTGGLDLAFGSDGLTITGGLRGGADNPQALVLAPDGGSAVIGSTTIASTADLAVVKYTVGGDPDPAFGDSGRVVIPFEGLPSLASDGAYQPDGSLVLAGSIGPYPPDFHLVRLTPTGALDLAFGHGGRVVLGTEAAYDAAIALAMLPDGKILVGGVLEDGGAVLRFMPDGMLDPTFGDGGLVRPPLPSSGARLQVQDLAILTDGRIVVSGSVSFPPAGFKLAGLARMHPDGSPDLSLGTVGAVAYGSGSDDTSNRALAVLPDGGYLLVGTAFRTMPNRNRDFVLLRLQPDGTLHQGFGEGGIALTDLSPFDYAEDVVVQRDGRILVTGRTTNLTPTGAAVLLARYEPNGQLDASFGEGGLVGLPSGMSAEGRAVALDRNERLLVAGEARVGGDGDVFIARYITSAPTASEPPADSDGVALRIAPNPARQSGTLTFTIPTSGEADVRVYDVLGREVAVLAEGLHAAGQHQRRVGTLPPGVYLVRLRAGGGERTVPFTIVR